MGFIRLPFPAIMAEKSIFRDISAAINTSFYHGKALTTK
jgi:hypothetical protein